MTPLRIHTLGFRGVGSQIDRIEEGFRELGCVITTDPNEASLVYANDAAHYEQAIKVSGSAKLILNVLDLAPHLGGAFPLLRVKHQLARADAVTCISTAVHHDLLARGERDAAIIYNPTRDVARNRPLLPPNHRTQALFVGRVNDPEKRSMVAASALSILGFEWDQIVTAGRESPAYGGLYLGPLSDETLSLTYNSCTFLMCPTRHAFLGLPILEAMRCGTIPVVCNDLDIRNEFLPSSVFPEYDEVEPTAPSIARFVARFMQDNNARAEMSERVFAHYRRYWGVKLLPSGVAQAILDVYARLAPNWP